jgi:hypothetical protein
VKPNPALRNRESLESHSKAPDHIDFKAGTPATEIAEPIRIVVPVPDSRTHIRQFICQIANETGDSYWKLLSPETMLVIFGFSPLNSRILLKNETLAASRRTLTQSGPMVRQAPVSSRPDAHPGLRRS